MIIYLYTLHLVIDETSVERNSSEVSSYSLKKREGIRSIPGSRSEDSTAFNFLTYTLVEYRCFWFWLLNTKMGKGSKQRRQSGMNSSSSSAPCKGKDGEESLQCTKNNQKDDRISQPCKKCGDEICKLRELNLRLIRDTNTSRRLAKRDEEYETGISKARQQTAETNVLHLTNKVKLMSAVLEATCKVWELEKKGLFSLLVAARKETEEIAQGKEIAEQAWIADKEYHLSELRRTYEKINEDMSVQNQRVLLEKTELESQLNDSKARTLELESKLNDSKARSLELESQLNDSKARTLELIENFEEERNLWNFEKQNLQGNVAELQIEIDSMVSERKLLCHQNRELNTETESLKTQLNGSIARLAQIEDERVQNERVLQQCRTENIDLQSSLHESKEKSQALLRKIEEDTHLWDAEKNNLKDAVAELRAKHELMASEVGSLTQNNRELTVEAEFLKSKANELESELDESKKRTQELIEKIEDDQHLWDQKKSILEGTIADLQTEHEDLMLQLSRKKSVEEELLSTKSSLEEMKASASKDEVEIANLKSKLLAVTEERDCQLSDIKRHLSAMAEEKKSQLESLEDQFLSIAAGKRIMEEENESLQTKLASRTLIAKEEQVRLEGIVRKLHTMFNSLNKQMESSKVIAEEKDKLLVELQNRYSDFVSTKNCLEEKNDSLLNELEKCTMVSDENMRLQSRISELEASMDSLKKDIESKDNHLQKLLSQRQPLRKPLVPIVNGNGGGTPKQNAALNEKPKPKSVLQENGKSKVTVEKATPQKRELNSRPNGVLPENGKSHVTLERGTPKVALERGTLQKRELRGPTPKAAVPEKRSPNLPPQRPTPKRSQ